MYRCIECQKEYKEKPDYCECGNDTFQYIEEQIVIKEKPIKQPMTVEQKSQIISLIFFIICILLSVVVWIIPIKSATEEVTIKEEKPVVKNIPNIDKFWDSTPVKIKEIEQPKPEFKKEPIPLNVIPYENKPVQKPVQQKVVKQPKRQINAAKPALKPQAKKIELKPVQANQKPVTQQQNKPKEQQKVKQEKFKIINEQPQKQEIKPIEQPKKVYNPNSPQMLKYKGELRAALFRKLPVGSIQGSGTCSVHFSVDSTGKLVNRAFTKQSDNKSLNDAVYYMLMSVPRFSVPPSEYSGEMINMTFKINNGSYEITIN